MRATPAAAFVRRRPPAATGTPAVRMHSGAAPLVGLQRAAGNRAVSRLLAAGGVLQAKLVVGPADDVYEREADRVADEVMRAPAPAATAPPPHLPSPGHVQRCAACDAAAAHVDEREEADREESVPVRVLTAALPPPPPDAVQRCAACEAAAAREEREEGDLEESAPARMPVAALPPPPPDGVQRCACGVAGLAGVEERDEEEEPVRARALPGQLPRTPPGLDARLAGMRGGGAPLSPDLRGFFEPRFGRSLGDVRVHTGPGAAEAARAVHARAFTTGRDIVFGGGEFAPHREPGRRLLAHELAHVFQQDAGTLRRETYETRGVTFDLANLQARLDRTYWTARTTATFDLTTDPGRNDPEELDAVLSVVWSLPPPTRVTAETRRLVPIAARTLPAAAGAGTGTPATAPALLYEIVFRPPLARGGKPRMELVFRGSGAWTGTAPVAAPAAPASYQPTQPAFMRWNGFPGNPQTAAPDYFAAHPDEHRALFQWMENAAPATFDQVVTTATTRGRAATVTHRSAFRVRGTRTGTGSSATFTGLNLTLLGEGASVDPVQTAPANYRARDPGDWAIEEQQARTPAADRLGAVAGLATVPAAEQAAVKIAVAQYFSRAQFPARDTEVDVRVPLGNSGTVVLYTFRFGAGNAVAVTRVGQAGTGAGEVNTGRLDVERVRGFPGRTAAPAALRAWWAARYPRGGALPAAPAATGTPATGTTQQGQGSAGGAAAAQQQSAQLVTAMSALIAAGVARADWFKDNWGIEVLAAADTATRLQTVHNVPAARTGDTLDFDATDLQMLELGLQTLTDSELARLRGVRLGRKTASLRRAGRGFAAGGANSYGYTLQEPSGETTVLYFGPLYRNDVALFTGSTAANALPAVVMNVVHELGHATGYQAGIEAAFTAWRTRNRPANPTWYAASDPGGEFFPEAFALYHTDPHWLCGASPLVYAWFDQLATTGTPPAATATLTPPATCPP